MRHTLLPFNIHLVVSSPGSFLRREIMLTTTQINGSPGQHDASRYDGSAHDNFIAFRAAQVA